jgi:hypothetical protein
VIRAYTLNPSKIAVFQVRLLRVLVYGALFFALVPVLNPWAQSPPIYYPPDPFELKGIHVKGTPAPPGPGSQVPSNPDLQAPVTSPMQDRDNNSLPAGHQGSIIGRVVERDSKGSPIESKGVAGALIQVSDGFSVKTCISKPDGTFYMEGVQPGKASITVSHRHYRQTQGTVSLAGDPRRVLIGMTPLSTHHEKEKGYINVYAYQKDGHHGHYIPVTSIRVQESGGGYRKWYDSWDGSSGSSYQKLNCSNATVGSYYQIKVIWKDRTERTTDIHLTEKYRDVSIYP